MFGFSRKKTEPPKICDCSFKSENVTSVKSISVFGTENCGSCHTLYERVQEVAQELGIAAEIEFVADIKKAIEHGIIGMPGLVVNEKVVCCGKLLTNAEIKEILLKTK